MTPASRQDGVCHDTLISVTGKGTAKRTVRMDEALWDSLGEAAEASSTDRATVIKDLVRWWLGMTAEPPQRPDPLPES